MCFKIVFSISFNLIIVFSYGWSYHSYIWLLNFCASICLWFDFLVCGIAILICLTKMLFGINHEIQELKLNGNLNSNMLFITFGCYFNVYLCLSDKYSIAPGYKYSMNLKSDFFFFFTGGVLCCQVGSIMLSSFPVLLSFSNSVYIYLRMGLFDMHQYSKYFFTPSINCNLDYLSYLILIIFTLKLIRKVLCNWLVDRTVYQN